MNSNPQPALTDSEAQEERLKRADNIFLKACWSDPWDTARRAQTFALVEPKDFYDPFNGRLYEVFREADANGSFTQSWIDSALRERGLINEVNARRKWLDSVTDIPVEDLLCAARGLLEERWLYYSWLYFSECSDHARRGRIGDLLEARKLTAPVRDAFERLKRLNAAANHVMAA